MEKYFCPESLELAWERYRAYDYDDVKDNVGIDLYSADPKSHLDLLSNNLLYGGYKPTRPLKYYEPKSNLLLRTKTILTQDDAIVYQAIIDEIAYLYSVEFKKSKEISFGRQLHECVNKSKDRLLKEKEYSFCRAWQDSYNDYTSSLRKTLKRDKPGYKLEADISGYFDSIPHSLLLIKLRDKYKLEKEVIQILNKCLIKWSGTRNNLIPGLGIPQGPQPSYFLANLYLHDLDLKLLDRGYCYYRYMDDIKIFSNNRHELKNAMIFIDQELRDLGLQINQLKSNVVHADSIENEIANLEEIEIYFGKENEVDTNLKDIVKSIQGKSIPEEEGIDIEVHNDEDFQLTDENVSDVLTFCKREMRSLNKYVSNNFYFSRGKANFHHNVGLEGVRMAVRYRNVVQLKRLIYPKFEPSPKYITVWTSCLSNAFWRADRFMEVLRLYPSSDELKDELIDVFSELWKYEWVRHQIVEGMIDRQELTMTDLRFLYREARNSTSWYVRLPIYKLILTRLESDNHLVIAATNRIKWEEDENIKSMLYWGVVKHNTGDLDKKSLSQVLGVNLK